MSKIKDGGLDQYGDEPFEQQQFGTAGVEGVKSYCLPHIMYACEALPFSKTDILRLDNLIARAVCRIFNIHSRFQIF